MDTVHAFDAYGTLFDVHSAVAAHAAEVGPEARRLSELWRSRQLEYTWVLNGIGAYRDFEVLTREALDYAAAAVGGVDAALKARLLGAYAELAAFPDVRPALEAAKGRGEGLLVFSNATPAMLDRAIRAAGLSGLFDGVLSVDTVGAYKPTPAAYGLLDPWRGRTLRFYSSNRWDVAGAVATGIDTIWVNRTGAADEYPTYPPAAVARDLGEALHPPPA